MGRACLLELPRELRHQIYVEVLSSPTGYLIPSPLTSLYSLEKQRFLLQPFDTLSYSTSNHGRILLNIILTCKQIHQEARDIVFETNTWAISTTRRVLFGWQFKGLDINLGCRMRHVCLDICLSDRSFLENTTEALRVLSKWAHEGGNLKTMTLYVIRDYKEMMRVLNIRAFGEPLEPFHNGYLDPNAGHKLYHEYLAVFRKSWGQFDTQWAGARRKLDLRMGHIITEPCVGDPSAMVKEMHDAFGGELWFNGKLCYENGKEILQPFKLDSQWSLEPAWAPSEFVTRVI